MYMNDVHKKEQIRGIATQDLRKLGIKFRPKKLRQIQDVKGNKKVFKKQLNSLPMQTVTLRSGQQLIVPKIVHELCSFILSKAETEGLFRKAGSKSRQNEIRLSLDSGCDLGNEHHEVDVANVLKTFLRELPEPLVPYAFHDIFIRCIILENNKKLEAVILACLLLPMEHLNTLAYIMQFLQQLTEFSELNKMDSYNLAVVIGPNILPVEEKPGSDTQLKLMKNCELFKLMIENSGQIGYVPKSIIEKIALTSSSSILLIEEDNAAHKKKKKRRSGSLTRMFNGLKKYVGGKISEDTSQPAIVTPDLLLTPCITRSSKKRKIDNNGFSLKKKRELVHNLPQGTVLTTPFTPHRTPISVHPNPKRNLLSSDLCHKSDVITKEKKCQWYSRNKINKTSKTEDDGTFDSKTSLGTKTLLERRWSAVNNATSFKKNKRNSCAAALEHKNKSKIPETCLETANKLEPDYVKISKTEYEEIKNRVSEIERRISIELESVKAQVVNNENNTNTAVESNQIKHVQTAYEQTLVQAEPMSPTTDHLAKRLSRELKIRRSTEQKIFRSPSARKIGNLRRRSRELERQNARLSRNQSWHFSNETLAASGLKKSQPNTVLIGLQYPQSTEIDNFSDYNTSMNKRITRSSSLNSELVLSFKSANNRYSSGSSGSTNKWTSAEGFFQTISTPNTASKLDNCRASLVRLRNQNAGMVQAKAKLFNEMLLSDKSNSGSLQNTTEKSTVTIPRAKATNKLGSTRNADKVSYRVRTLKYEDRRLPRKSMSPRKKLTSKTPNLTSHQKLQIVKKYVDEMTENKKIEKENQNCIHNVSCECVDIVKNPISPLKDCNRIDIFY